MFTVEGEDGKEGRRGGGGREKSKYLLVFLRLSPTHCHGLVCERFTAKEIQNEFQFFNQLAATSSFQSVLELRIKLHL